MPWKNVAIAISTAVMLKVAALLSNADIHAQEPPGSAQVQQAEEKMVVLTKEEIRALIAQLDHNEFPKREDALKDLDKNIDSAFDQVAAARHVKNAAELAGRVDMLYKKHFQRLRGNFHKKYQSVESRIYKVPPWIDGVFEVRPPALYQPVQGLAPYQIRDYYVRKAIAADAKQDYLPTWSHHREATKHLIRDCVESAVFTWYGVPDFEERMAQAQKDLRHFLKRLVREEQKSEYWQPGRLREQPMKLPLQPRQSGRQQQSRLGDVSDVRVAA